MKKSTILTFATAAAVLATSAGTFAAWDKISDTQTGTLTYANSVTINETLDAPAKVTYDLGTETIPDAQANVTFKVDDKDKRAGVLTVVPTVKQGEADLVTEGKVKVTVKKGGEALVDNKDSSIAENNDYTVVITPTDTATFNDLNGATLSVTGTLSEK